MGSEEDEEGFAKSGLTGKLAFTGSSLFVVVLLVIILLHCYGKHLRRLQQRRRQRIASLYQLSTQSNNVGAVPLELINFEQPQPKNGLDPLVIALLPEFVYKPKAKNDHDHDHKDEGDEQVIDCSVCLSTIDEETTVRLLPNCKHVFHVECIDMWLGSNTTCPICRAVVEPRVQDLQAEGGSGQAVQATAPPMAMDDEGSRVQQGDEVEKASASGSRLSSFRRMFSSRDRSSRRVETCGQEDAAADDLERQ